MYEVIDVKHMMKKTTHHVRKRRQALKGYDSVLLLRAGTKLDLIPANSELRKVGDVWEVHIPIKNKEIVKKLALALDAVAFL